MLAQLPDVLAEHLDLREARLPAIGFSPEKMYLLPYGYDGKPAVLKYSKRHEVKEEGDIYVWLKGKLPVPEVYFNEKIGDTYYLVSELIDGQMLSECFMEMGQEQCLINYGHLIKTIHETDIEGFPYVHDKTYKLEKVKKTVLAHEAKIQYFERELQGRSPESMLAYLIAHQDFEEDLVFSHGDVCFPNFIYDHQALQAVLDVSGAGINDRHLDLAIALRTLRYNFELAGWDFTSKEIDCFLSAYGIQKVDMNKITFYILLDELTNG